MLDKETHDELVKALHQIINSSKIPTLPAFMDSVPAMLFYIDDNEICQIANEAFCNFSGLPIDKVIGEHVKNVIGKKLYLQIKDQVGRVLKGETIAVRKSFKIHGETNDIQSVLSPNQNLKAEVLGCFCVFTEVIEEGEQVINQWYVRHKNVIPIRSEVDR